MAPEYLCELVSIRVAAPTLWNKLPANIRKVFLQTLFGVLLYYILFVQRLWMASASKEALLNIHYYFYYYYYYYECIVMGQLPVREFSQLFAMCSTVFARYVRLTNERTTYKSYDLYLVRIYRQISAVFSPEWPYIKWYF